MSYLSDPKFVTAQYKDSSNLDARIALHARYSRNPQGWTAWLFEQIELPPACRVLELGCGSGVFWQNNHERIPAGWEIVLSDNSIGMARRSREALRAQQSEPRFAESVAQSYAQINAERLPFAPASFDAVLANHMLYHVPDRAAALAEIRRVLRIGGRLYAATNGEGHMRELDQLACDFDPRLDFGDPRLTIGFTLENGAGQLAEHFPEVELRRYLDGLDVTDAAPLADYIVSMARYATTGLQRENLVRWLEAELARRGGVIPITKSGGVFIAKRT